MVESIGKRAIKFSISYCSELRQSKCKMFGVQSSNCFVAKKTITLQHVSSEMMIADILTKPLASQRTGSLARAIGMK